MTGNLTEDLPETASFDDHALPIEQLGGSQTQCSCILCYFPGCSERPRLEKGYMINRTHPCCFPGCNEMINLQITAIPYDYIWKRSKHEKSHYIHEGKFRCREEHCSVTVKSWTDLKRHYASKHCKNSKKFPCRYIGCSRGGENGFPREDKLKSHVQSVHEKKTPRRFQHFQPGANNFA